MTRKDMITAVSGCLQRSRGTISENVQSVDEWLFDFLYQSLGESKIKKDYCEVCGRRHNPRDLELHHPAGQKHDFRTITVCKKCHARLTSIQRIWGPDWEHPDRPQLVKDRFLLMGLREVLLLRAGQTGDSYCQAISDGLIEEIRLASMGDDN
jgi:hypothetical protein